MKFDTTSSSSTKSKSIEYSFNTTLDERSPFELGKFPLCFELSVPELLVPALWWAVWRVSVRGQLAVVEQDVGHVGTNRQGDA